MASAKIILRKDKAKGIKIPLYLQIILSRDAKTKYPLKLYVAEQNWVNQPPVFVKGTGNDAYLNNQLFEQLNKATRILHRYEIEGKTLSLPEFDQEYRGSGSKPSGYKQTLVQWIRYAVREIKAPVQKNRTTLGHGSVANLIAAYDDSILLSDVNLKWLMNLEGWLKAKGYGHNYIVKIFTVLKTYINLAISTGDYPREQYPFGKNKFSPGKYKSKPNFLTKDQLQAILQIKGLKPGVEMARLRFVFSCFTGLRFSDIQDLRWTDIITINNQYKISKYTIKTDEYIYIPLPKRATEILQALDKNRETVFPPITNQKYNEHLKTIAHKCDVHVHLTSHVARHTFGTQALNNGMDFELVKKILGLKKDEIVRVYARLLNTTLDQAMRVMDNF